VTGDDAGYITKGLTDAPARAHADAEADATSVTATQR